MTKDEILGVLKVLDKQEFPDYKLGDQVRYCKRNFEIFEEVNLQYPGLFENNKEFKYYLLNRNGQNPNYPNEMFCPTCGKRIPYGKGYKAHCSNRCSSLDPNVKSKKDETCLANNGWTSPFQREDVKKKIKETMDKNYDGNPMFSPEVKQKLIETNYKRYGVYNHKLSNIKHLEDYNEEFIKDHFIKNNKFLLNEIVEYFNISYSHAENIKIRYDIHNSNKDAYHKSEVEVLNYIQSLIPNEEIYSNNRSIIKNEDGKLELDIFIPSKNLAFEYDGLYWHGIHDIYEDVYKNTSKHLTKTEECEKRNIRLLHIFENEWKDPIKNKVWKSVIKNILDLSDRKIYARKCEIKEITSPQEAFNFIQENHIQPAGRSSIKIGLYYLGELVSIMTFGKPRYDTNVEYELIRYCNKINTSVVGGASKLFNYFIKKYNPKSIISYADRKWSVGSLYYKLGFELDHISPPSYYYVHPKSGVHHRGEFKKKMLKDKLQIFNESLTESENMFNNGYYKIYDCGTYAFIWKSNNS